MFRDQTFYGGIDEWRKLWNREVRPYLRSLEVVAGPGMLADRLPGGTLLRLVPGDDAPAAGSAAAAEYDSYFKLTLTSSENNGATTYAVTIADGATGGSSTAVVNGYTTYTLAPYTETVTGDRLFFLKYTPATLDADGSVADEAVMEIGSSDDMTVLSAGTDGAFRLQLGRLLWNNGAPKVVQDFKYGVAEVRWYARCGVGA